MVLLLSDAFRAWAWAIGIMTVLLILALIRRPADRPSPSRVPQKEEELPEHLREVVEKLGPEGRDLIERMKARARELGLETGRYGYPTQPFWLEPLLVRGRMEMIAEGTWGEDEETRKKARQAIERLDQAHEKMLDGIEGTVQFANEKMEEIEREFRRLRR